MFTKIAHFEKTIETEGKATQSVMDSLTDKSLSQSVANDHRTLGRIAWHIITTIPEMINRTGLNISCVDPKAPVPATADKIKKAYVEVISSLKSEVMAKWDDNALEQEDDLYGEQWKRGSTLMILISHEIHHRGQMTVLMRQAGLRVPSIYGPAKEDWAGMDMPVPEV